MFGYILNKIFYGFFDPFWSSNCNFILFTILPGDPARMMLDQREDSNQLQNIREKYGFDKPKITQFLYYINDLSPISFSQR